MKYNVLQKTKEGYERMLVQVHEGKLNKMIIINLKKFHRRQLSNKGIKMIKN